jgi:hypothetical protein
MSRFLRMFAIALLALFIIVPAASAQRGFYGGRGYYGGGWGGGWGGWYGPGWGLGWYGPYWGYPYGYGYYGNGGYGGPRYGDVKIVGTGKDAMVYVDGGYAGKAGDLKKFRLPVGDHNIELRDPSGHPFHQEKIDVIPGKTLEIRGSAQGH